MSTPSFDTAASGVLSANAYSKTLTGVVVNDHADRILLAAWENPNGGSSHCTAVARHSQSFTLLATVGLAGYICVDLYYLLAPDVGTYDLTFTLGSSPLRGVGSALSFYNVLQGDPFGDYVTATGTSATPSATVTDYASADLLVDFGGIRWLTGETLTVGADQTERTNVTDTSLSFGFSSTQLGTAGGVMSWSSSASHAWRTIALALHGGLPPISGAGGMTQQPHAFAGTGAVQTQQAGGGAAAYLLTQGGPHQRLVRAQGTRWRERTYRKNAAGLYVGADA